MVQKGIVGNIDEKLRSRAIHDIGPSHGDSTAPVFQPIFRFVFNRGMGWPFDKIWGHPAPLDHEAGNDSMEYQPLIEFIIDIAQKIAHK